MLLREDIAIVIMDVWMPDVDGFELAAMIRQHPRCQKTAIVFVSAVHLSDIDRVKGYETGAIDYLPVPDRPRGAAREDPRARRPAPQDAPARALEQRARATRAGAHPGARGVGRAAARERGALPLARRAHAAPGLGGRPRTRAPPTSPRWYEYTGAPAGDRARRRLASRRLPPRRPRAACDRGWRKATESAAAYPLEYETRIRRSDGVYRWFQAHRRSGARRRRRRVDRWVGTCTDIEERTPRRGGPARGRPAQGRVPRHARPRAAQSARADPERRAAAAPDAAQSDAASELGPRRDRAPGRAAHPPGRRPARRLAHHARQDPAPGRAAGPGGDRHGRRRDQPPDDRRAPPRAARAAARRARARLRRPRAADAGRLEPAEQRGEVPGRGRLDLGQAAARGRRAP